MAASAHDVEIEEIPEDIPSTTVHLDESESNDEKDFRQPPNATAFMSFNCDHCSNTYRHKSSLYRHIKTDHAKENFQSGTIKCTEGCSEKFRTSDDLIKHLCIKHNKSINIIHKSFSTLHEFIKWKESFEENARSSYVLHCAPKCHSDSSYISYCNRSGKYASKGKGVRELKMQGSSKIGTHCPAYIRAKKDEDGQLEVKLCNYHIHELQLHKVQLPLSLSTRKKVAAKLADGVTVSNIFDSIREQSLDGVLHRKHLLCRQDIHNIKHQYNIEGVQLHSDDHTSVSLLVKNMMESMDNPVFIYKKQGQKQSPDINDLADEDFVVGIQTCFQRDMMIKFQFVWTALMVLMFIISI
uniref:C2H2-type domain-containing protein n=1 Tax=Amphimedon queenslandica TaxID=400682 RepID=A0A1X7VUM5_AMPQE